MLQMRIAVESGVPASVEPIRIQPDWPLPRQFEMRAQRWWRIRKDVDELWRNGFLRSYSDGRASRSGLQDRGMQFDA
jgi:hypothetical protein